MTCKERGRIAKLARAMQYVNNPELSSPEETRCQFNGGTGAIKLGIDVHQGFLRHGRAPQSGDRGKTRSGAVNGVRRRSNAGSPPATRRSHESVQRATPVSS